MVAQEYRVRLEAFEGPLDLLLFLLKKAEVDINEISVGRIADQYLEYIARLDDIDVERAAEFLVTASAIVELKSRLVQQAAEPEEGRGAGGDAPERDASEPISAGEELVRQLLAYKACREAADRLAQRQEEWTARFPSGRAGHENAPDTEDDEEPAEIEDIGLSDIADAFARIAASVQFDRLGDHTIEADDTPLELHRADLRDSLERAGAMHGSDVRVPLRRILEGRSRIDMIGLFLALLEMVRWRTVRVFREEDTGDVLLQLFERGEDEEGVGEPGPDQRAPMPGAWEDDHIVGDEEDEEEEELP